LNVGFERGSIVSAAAHKAAPSDDNVVDMIVELARRNEALEDFAALVAHELKTPLLAALAADEPAREIENALELVDALLESSRDAASVTSASAAQAFEQAVRDLGAHDVEFTADLDAMVPLPPASLRVILRNLLANAVAAGAHHVHVSAPHSASSWQVVVEDDGAGLEGDGYATGSGIGFGLSRRIAERFGGGLELAPRSLGGTCAILELGVAA